MTREFGYPEKSITECYAISVVLRSELVSVIHYGAALAPILALPACPEPPRGAVDLVPSLENPPS